MYVALEFVAYLPQLFAKASEHSYLDFLWAAFQTNFAAERYELASLTFHLIHLSFVSFPIWQIKLALPGQRAIATTTVRFDRQEANNRMACKTPLEFYDSLRESWFSCPIRLIGCTNGQVSGFAKLVKRRNKIAQPTGTVF